MLVSQENGDGGRRQTPSGETRAAAARRGKASFLPSFAALKDRVAKACGGEEAWEAQVVAGVRAVLEFAAADPQAAHALTVEARRRATGEVDLEQEAISYFAGLLREAVGGREALHALDRGGPGRVDRDDRQGTSPARDRGRAPGDRTGPRLHHADAVSGDLRGAALGGVLGGLGT